ncbi:MAG: hypothetical protein IPP62_15900 [bacterium]|nr:hypothetical protein [bacterium]
MNVPTAICLGETPPGRVHFEDRAVGADNGHMGVVGVEDGAHEGGLPREGVLGELAFGDVAHDTEDDMPGLVILGSRMDMTQRAVEGSLDGELDVVGLATLHQARQRRIQCRAELPQGNRLRLSQVPVIARQAVDLARTVRTAHGPLLQVQFPVAEAGNGFGAIQARLALANLVFGLFAPGNIQERGHDATRAHLAVAKDRSRRDLDPARPVVDGMAHTHDHRLDAPTGAQRFHGRMLIAWKRRPVGTDGLPARVARCSARDLVEG